MRIRWWMPLAAGVGLAATATGTLIATSLSVRPQQVVARPYAAGAEEDTRAAERAAFAARGWQLSATPAADGVTLVLDAPGTPAPALAVVRLYRPDDATADRTLAWEVPAQPLAVPLPRPGVWEVRVLVRDAEGGDLATTLRLSRP